MEPKSFAFIVESSAQGGLTQLVKKNRSALRHIGALHTMYKGDDPTLQSKEAQAHMQALMTQLHQQGKDAEVNEFGGVVMEPAPVSFVNYFDLIGPSTLAGFFGFEGLDDMPQSEEVKSLQAEIQATRDKEKADFEREEFEPED